jgi:hypothetical protein
MTAPQVIATIFFMISIGSVLALASMAAVSGALDAWAGACERLQPSARSVSPPRLSSHVACRAGRAVLSRLSVQ